MATACDQCGGNLEILTGGIAICTPCNKFFIVEREHPRPEQVSGHSGYAPPVRNLEAVQQASKQAREDYWHGKTRFEAMRGWREETTLFLQKLQGTGEEEFFRRLGIAVSDPDAAMTLHDIFCAESGGKGEIQFYVDKILTTFSPDEIDTYREIIQALTRIYGEKPGELANFLIQEGKQKKRREQMRA